MEAFGGLILVSIKWGLVAATIAGLLRLYTHRNDGQDHALTIQLTSGFGCFSVLAFLVTYLYTYIVSNNIAGDYYLQSYKCEPCLGCVVRLKNNGTYTLLKNEMEIDKGDWDFTQDPYTTFITVDNGVGSNDIETKTISAIKNDNCQNYRRNQNLQQAINGKMIGFGKANNSRCSVYSFFYEDLETKDTILYEPQYSGHPWLNEELSAGCLIHKAANSMTFEITKPNGITIVIAE
jgi:hypothetical protein